MYLILMLVFFPLIFHVLSIPFIILGEMIDGKLPNEKE